MIRKINVEKLSWVVLVLAAASLFVWGFLRPHGTVVFPSGEIDVLHSDGSKAHFQVELATTPQQQEMGLMFRKHLAQGTGMLFMWPQEQAISMWMKNTLIPLDMLFVDRDAVIVKIIPDAKPLDLTPLTSDGPVRAVVEIGGGEAARNNIKTGEKLLFPGFLH